VFLAGCSGGDSGENGNASGNGNASENGNDDPAPAELAVSSLDIAGQGEEATVQSGSDSEVAVTVENVGEQSGSFDVMLSASGVSQSQIVELGGGESQTLTFEGLVSELESGTQSSFSVAADGEEVSGAVDAAVTVEEPGEPAMLAFSGLNIAGQGPDATVEGDSDGAVTVTVENVGEQSDSFDIMLSASGVSQSQTVELGGGESQTLAFEGLLSELESGTQSSLSVAADGEEVGGAVDAAVTVEEPGEPAMLAFSGLNIAGQGPDATVEGDSDGAVTVTVENVGEQSGSFDVTLSADSVSERQTVELAGGESQTVTFEGAVAALESGTSALTVAAGDAETSGQVTVGGSTTAFEKFRSQFTAGTAYEFESTGPQGSTTGRFNNGDQYLRFETSQGTGEYYFVGGAAYSVQDDQCFVISEAPVDPTEPPDEDELEEDRISSVTRIGTETIDGETVAVYEVVAEGFGPGDTTYYLSENSGRLRRMVFDGQRGQRQIDFLAWGDDVDPVTRPDMNCRSLQDN
jgi:copper(I)-binding protein